MRPMVHICWPRGLPHLRMKWAFPNQVQVQVLGLARVVALHIPHIFAVRRLAMVKAQDRDRD